MIISVYKPKSNMPFLRNEFSISFLGHNLQRWLIFMIKKELKVQAIDYRLWYEEVEIYKLIPIQCTEEK